MRALSLIRIGRVADATADVELGIAQLRDLGMAGTFPYAHGLIIEAFALKEQGRLLRARQAIEDAITAYSKLGDEARVAAAQCYLADIAFCEGDDVRAVELVSNANAICLTVGAMQGLLDGRANEAAYRLALGDVLGARDAALDALALARRGQKMEMLMIALQHIATVAALSGDARSAALLVGYINFRRAHVFDERELTERRTYNILMSALRINLNAQERSSLISEGESFEEEQAVKLALAIA